MTLPWDWIIQTYRYLMAGEPRAELRTSYLDITNMTVEKLDDLNLPPQVKRRLWLKMELEKEKSRFHF